MPPKGALERLTCRATASRCSNSVASTMDICNHINRAEKDSKRGFMCMRQTRSLAIWYSQCACIITSASHTELHLAGLGLMIPWAGSACAKVSRSFAIFGCRLDRPSPIAFYVQNRAAPAK